MLAPEEFWKTATADPTGSLSHGIELVRKYRSALIRQHGLIFAAWRRKEFERTVIETHFFLVALDRMNDGLALISKALGGAVKTAVDAKNFGEYRDARNHFEHLDDRLFGTKRNTPATLTENGATRTIHFGLYKDQTFGWGAKRIDISGAFLSDFLGYADAIVELALGSLPTDHE
jgi:hypothetical protein